MERKCVFWSRSLFYPFLSFFLALVILFLSALDVKAESLDEHWVGSYQYTLSNYKGFNVGMGSGNTLLPSSNISSLEAYNIYGNGANYVDGSWGFDANVSGVTEFYTIDYYLSNEKPIFTPSSEYYAYRIIAKPNTITSFSMMNTVWVRPYVGTYNQLYEGNGILGKPLSGTSSSDWSSFYVVTNYSTANIYLGMLQKYMACDLNSAMHYGNWRVQNLVINLEVHGYTKEEYYASIDAELKEQTETQKDILEQDKAQTEELKEQTGIQEDILEEDKAQTDELKEQTETQKGLLNKITEFFGSFFQNLIDSVIGLFVPSKEELSSIFNRFDEFFSSKFGFLYYPFEVLGDFLNVFGTPISEPQLTFPAFSIMGYEVWGAHTFYIGREPFIREIFTYVRMGTSSIIVFAFINYCSKKFKGVVNK